MDLNLENHVAVVTGGFSGIGRAVAEEFANEGTLVAIWDLSDSVAGCHWLCQCFAGSAIIDKLGSSLRLPNESIRS